MKKTIKTFEAIYKKRIVIKLVEVGGAYGYRKFTKDANEIKSGKLKVTGGNYVEYPFKTN